MQIEPKFEANVYDSNDNDFLTNCFVSAEEFAETLSAEIHYWRSEDLQETEKELYDIILAKFNQTIEENKKSFYIKSAKMWVDIRTM